MKNYSLLFLLTFITAIGLSQTKSKQYYEKKRNELLKQIDQTSKVLEETQSKKKASTYQLRVLNQQLTARETYIKALNEELAYTNSEIAEVQDIISGMEADIIKLKKEYAKMIYEASKTDDELHKMTYIFSSSSINELANRLNYLRQYNESRQTQLRVIKQVMDMLEKEKEDLQKKQVEKNDILKQLLNKKNELFLLKNEKTKIVNELSQKEQKYKDDIQKWQKEQDEIKKIIADIIKKEALKNKAQSLAYKKDIEVKSRIFAENKGKLNWPVKHCKVIRNFGIQPHPFLQDVKENNLGIGLKATEYADVYSVFDGKVKLVATIRGKNQMVMIEHGEYFTVYNNITNVKVKAGDIVTTKQVIGEVSKNTNGEVEMEFQIWKSSAKAEPTNLNPSLWLH